LEQDIQDRAARTGQQEQESQNRTASFGATIAVLKSNMHTIAIEQPLHNTARGFREICVNFNVFSKRKTKICEINTK
jgi:hypothetical protein